MPYLFWGQEPSDNIIHDSNEKNSLLRTSRQETQNLSHEKINPNKYNSESGTKLKPISPAQNQRTRASTLDLYTSNVPIHGAATDKAERRVRVDSELNQSWGEKGADNN
jgi:hypothetical protein